MGKKKAPQPPAKTADKPKMHQPKVQPQAQKKEPERREPRDDTPTEIEDESIFDDEVLCYQCDLFSRLITTTAVTFSAQSAQPNFYLGKGSLKGRGAPLNPLLIGIHGASLCIFAL
jgi:hypothetical protein